MAGKAFKQLFADAGNGSAQGKLKSAATGTAVAFDDDTPQPKELRTIVSIGIEILSQALQDRPQQKERQPLMPGCLEQLFTNDMPRHGRRAFDRFQRDVPDETIADNDFCTIIE